MATATLPRAQGTRRGWWIVGGIILIVAMIGIALFIVNRQNRTAVQVPVTTLVTPNRIVASVKGSGTVAAVRSLDLPFATSGTVTDVLVQEGDNVAKGQVLARLDDRTLQMDVANAQTSLNSAKAKLAQVQNGNATKEDIAAQQAAVANAEAQLKKTRTGTTTAADIAAQQAALRSAQAQLDALKNPSSDKVSSAQLTVTQSDKDLQATRDSDSAAKTKAEQDLQKSVNALTQAQSSYATAKQQWEYVQSTGKNPTNPTTTNASGKPVDNKVNSQQQQQYYDTFVQAEAAMKSAEQAVAQSQVTFDNARQQEVTDVQKAEAKLADAQQQLTALQNPDANAVTQAQASVDQARANLAKLQQGGITAADIAASQASLDQARANLAKLTAPATDTDISIQQASVDQADQALKQAQLNLENAELKAPFAGIVTVVNISPGSQASNPSSGSTGALSLMDRSTLHVDLKLSENDVAKIKLTQPVTLTIDALSDWKAQGTVTYIAPTATTTNDVVTYAVRVSFPDTDTRVKVGMTANLTIVTAQKDNALLVPNTALLPKGSGRVVQVLNADNTTREVDVQTGLTDGSQTEITSGLKAGDKVVTAPSSTPTTRRGGPFGLSAYKAESWKHQ